MKIKRSIFGASPSPKNISKPQKPAKGLYYILREFKEFIHFFHIYTKGKVFAYSTQFERNKNKVVKSVLIKRGKRNRVFLHLTTMSVLTAGVIISPYISEANLFSDEVETSFAQEVEGDLALTPEDVFETRESEKPRDEVVTYTVQKGDTVSTVAEKYGVTEDTIRWANGLKNDRITVGDQLKVLPVSGIAHKVERGDTVYTIAKKYDTNPQGIVDFPFNDFANPQTFSLIEGQIVIVPEGVMPQEKPVDGRRQRQTYIATGPVSVSGAGFTWPVRGTMNQYYAWYHRAVDIGTGVGTPIVAAQSGTVAAAYTGGWNGGYGIHVILQGDNGYQTLYAHMSSLNVSAGDTVVAGKSVLGWVGMTGRTTGPHLHFEIRGSGGLLNPLSFLQ